MECEAGTKMYMLFYKQDQQAQPTGENLFEHSPLLVLSMLGEEPRSFSLSAGNGTMRRRIRKRTWIILKDLTRD